MRTSNRSCGALASVAALAFLGLGCASLEQRLQRWEGHPIAELVKDRGPAKRIVSYPYGGRLYIWESERLGGSPPDASGRRSAGLAGPRSRTVVREVALVDDNGVIVRIHVESDTSP